MKPSPRLESHEWSSPRPPKASAGSFVRVSLTRIRSTARQTRIPRGHVQPDAAYHRPGQRGRDDRHPCFTSTCPPLAAVTGHCYAAWRRSLSCRPIPQRMAGDSRIERQIRGTSHGGEPKFAGTVTVPSFRPFELGKVASTVLSTIVRVTVGPRAASLSR